MHFPILKDLLIILLFAAGVVYALQRIKIPAILGFILTGILIGPFGMGLISAIHEIEVIAEIGIILLLFVIGIELSLKQLFSIRRTVFLGGMVQVGLSIALVGLITWLGGLAWQQAVFMGFLVSLSSTAIVLKLLQDKNEIAAPHGRNALGILIFQDIIVVPMMLVVPIMAGETDSVTTSVMLLFAKTFAVLVFTYLLSRFVLPVVFYQVAKTGNKELFLITTFLLCFSLAFLTAEAGLSMALGAFIAGLLISESDYSHQAAGTILPFRELFTSFFFVSVGMLLDFGFFVGHLWIIVGLTLAVAVLKVLVVYIAVAVLKYPTRTTLLTGIVLFQIGEFSLILSDIGIEYRLLTPDLNQYFLSVSILTMLLTPFAVLYADRWTRPIVENNHTKKTSSDIKNTETLKNHLVIIGYGLNGSNVAKAADYAHIPYHILELNPETVKREKAKGLPIHYGDAMKDAVLETVGIDNARVVVVAISDPQATKTIVANIRQHTQSARIVVRTRYTSEIPDLLAIGADEVIPEEFETSIEIFTRVMHSFMVPLDEVDTFVEKVRSDNYRAFRQQAKPGEIWATSPIPELRISCVRVLGDSNEVIGKTIAEAQIRQKYGITILAVQRNGVFMEVHSPDIQIRHQDTLYLSGSGQNIEQFYRLIG
ncbi:MAG TPA: potassium transporter KefB [Bacteroidetes bacterium]|nr:potassium transporter KefB [Bacteroidota bacterium]